MKLLRVTKKLFKVQKLDLSLRSQLFFIAALATFSISAFTFAVGGLSAISWPTNEPAGEASGGLFGQYFRNMFGTDDPLTGGRECMSSGVLVGFEYNGIPRCEQLSNLLPPASVINPTISFTASNVSITSGQAVILAWSSSNADGCSNTWNTDVTPSGNTTVSPSTDTTYTLTCTNLSGGTKQASVSVVVVPSPGLVFTASPTSLISGNSTMLSWTGTNVVSCTKMNDWTGVASTGGTWSTGPLTSTKTYGLSCTDGTNTISQNVVVSVTSPLTPNILLSASSLNITSGSSVTLTWNVANAATCSASNGWSGAKSATNGSENLSPTSSRTYTITCTSSDGISLSKNVTVNVWPSSTRHYDYNGKYIDSLVIADPVFGCTEIVSGNNGIGTFGSIQCNTERWSPGENQKVGDYNVFCPYWGSPMEISEYYNSARPNERAYVCASNTPHYDSDVDITYGSRARYTEITTFNFEYKNGGSSNNCVNNGASTYLDHGNFAMCGTSSYGSPGSVGPAFGIQPRCGYSYNGRLVIKPATVNAKNRVFRCVVGGLDIND